MSSSLPPTLLQQPALARAQGHNFTHWSWAKNNAVTQRSEHAGHQGGPDIKLLFITVITVWENV